MKYNFDIKKFKLYIIIFCSIIMYAIITNLDSIFLNIFKIKNYNFIVTFEIIFQVLSIILSIIYGKLLYKKSIDELKIKFKNYIYGFLSIFIYFTLINASKVPLQLLNINIKNLSNVAKSIYSCFYELMIILIIIFINFNRLKKDFIDFKNNYKEYHKKYIKIWFLGLILMILSNFIIIFISNADLATNESTIREQLILNPFYIYISGVLFAPIIEELVFRLSIRNIISNDWLFIITSGIIFGSMHVFGSEIVDLNQLLYLIPYSSFGMCFAYMLCKSKNYFVSVSFHLLHNAILINFLIFQLLYL